MTKAGLAVCAAAMVIATGCGGSDQPSPESVVKDFVQAMNAGDFRAACDTLSDAGVESVRGITTSSLIFHGGDIDAPCPTMLKTARRVASSSNTLPHEVDVVDVDSQPDKATVKTRAGDWVLEEVNGDWKIADTPLQAP